VSSIYVSIARIYGFSTIIRWT